MNWRLLGLIVFIYLLFTLVITMGSAHAVNMKAEKGSPELNLIGEGAQNGVLLGLGVKNPDVMSNEFIHLDDYNQVVHTNKLWVVLYTPPEFQEEEVTIEAQFWQERKITVKEGNTTREVIQKYHRKNESYSFPYSERFRLVSLELPRHENLTHARLSYENLDFSFKHLSSPSGKALESPITTKGEMFDQIGFLLLVFALVGAASMLLGKKIYMKVKYVPTLGLKDLLPLGLVLALPVGLFYDDARYYMLHAPYWLTLVPLWAGFITFYSLQLYNPQVLNTMLLRILPSSHDQVAPEFETTDLVIVREKGAEYLVEPYSWTQVVYRLFSKGPLVEYQTPGNSNIVPIKDSNLAVDQIFLVDRDQDVLIQWPTMTWRTFMKVGPVELKRPGIDPGLSMIPLAPVHFEATRIQVMSSVLNADEAIQKADSERQQYNRLQARILRSREEQETDTAESILEELFKSSSREAGKEKEGEGHE